MKSRIRRGLLAFALGSALCLAAGEGALRVREYLRFERLAETWATYDPDLGYRLHPGYADINALGMRSPPVAPKGPRPRLLMLGDSVGYYGTTVAETWPGQLERELQEPAAGGAEVLNACVRGYTTAQEIGWLEKYGLPLEPDLVGLGFVVNDCHRVLHGFRIHKGRLIGQTYDFTEEALASAGERGRFATSYLWEWLRGRLKLAHAAREAETPGSFLPDAMPDLNTAWKDAPWQTLMEPLFRRLKELAAQHRFTPFVVAFPHALQYRADYLARDRAHLLKPQTWLRALCTRFGLPLLDLYDRVQPERDLEPDGLHLTAAGRARVARWVADFLREQGLLRDAAAGR